MTKDIGELQIIKHAGSHYECGYAHGSQARDKVHGSISSYTKLFEETAGLNWQDARELASSRLFNIIKLQCPDLLEELQGIADGAKVDLLDIVVLNCRSEIAMTQTRRVTKTDGCTALAQTCKDEGGHTLVAENWDWVVGQKDNIIALDLHPRGKRRIIVFSEAGIINKYGMNDAGFGLVLNAIRCCELDGSKLPTHILLRRLLETSSVSEAKIALVKYGIQSAQNIVMGDSDGHVVTVEASPLGDTFIEPNPQGMVFHTNHLYGKGIASEKLHDEPNAHSFFRLDRIRDLSVGAPATIQSFRNRLSDRVNAPLAISRTAPSQCGLGLMNSETILTVIEDLTAKIVEISLGQPHLNPPIYRLSFDAPPMRI